MTVKHMTSNIEVPEAHQLPTGGGYTGFNSVNLEEAYVCRRFPVRRSQIGHGWGKPVIQRQPGGRLAATGFRSLRRNRQPAYPLADEDTALFYSDDLGETWGEPRLLGIPGRPTQFSVLRDGRAILATSAWWDGGRDSRLYYSDDGLETFREARVGWEEFARDRRDGVVRGYGETNGVLELPGGTLLSVCFTLHHPLEAYDDFKAYVIRSDDGGRTWGDASFLVNTDEVELLLLPGGRILGFARLDTTYSRDVWGQGGKVGEGGDQMAVMESADGGRTWTAPTPVGLGMAQVPAFPLLYPDGRLILVYGNRQFPFGVQAIASRDLGRTWNLDCFLMLAYASWDNYGGHPRSLLLPDGTVATGYYARYFKDHPETINEDIVSHCLKWRPPPEWP
jgi:hypothetical protein